MTFSKASSDDIPAIMEIFHQAQLYLASQNVDQWQNGYPTEEIIINDIRNQENYIVKNKENIIVGTTMLTTNPEPTYSEIEGSWLSSENSVYGVIHRMAINANFRKSGIAQFMFNQCEQILKAQNIESMKIDTHEDNKGMRSLLRKLNYKYCGIILLEDGDKRLAYQKLIIPE